MPDWAFVLQTAGGDQIELAGAHDRQISYNLDAPDSASFTLNGANVEASEIVGRECDLLAYRDGELFSRGRLDQPAISGDANGIQLAVPSFGYRWMLGQKVLRAADQYVAAPAVAVAAQDVAWSFINTAQGRGANHSFGVTRGLHPATFAFSGQATAGNTVQDAIAQVAGAGSGTGFEWEVSELLEFNIFYPNRGIVQSAILDYVGDVLTFNVRPGDQYANEIRVAAPGLNEKIQASATASTDPTGIWQRNVELQEGLTQAQLDNRAGFLITQYSSNKPTIDITLKPGVWLAKTDFWIGDTITVQIISDGYTFIDTLRILTITISIDDDGKEILIITAGPLPPPWLTIFRKEQLLEQLRRQQQLAEAARRKLQLARKPKR